MADKLTDAQREKFDGVCALIAEGHSLKKACQLYEGQITAKTIYDWLAKDEGEEDGLRDRYTRAREAQADAIFDDCLDIADEAMNDKIVDEDGRERVNNEAVQRSRLRIDTRKWMAGKLRPKKYGDRIDVDLDAKVKADVTVESPIDKLKKHVDTVSKRIGAASKSAD